MTGPKGPVPLTPPHIPTPLPPSNCSLDPPRSSPPSLCQFPGRWFGEQSAVDSKSPSPGSAVARGPVERVLACIVLQLLWAHRAVRLAPACDVPAPPAPPGAGTVRGWACCWHPARHSFPHLFTSNQTNPSSCFEWQLQFQRMTEGQPCLRNCLLWAFPRLLSGMALGDFRGHSGKQRGSSLKS